MLLLLLAIRPLFQEWEEDEPPSQPACFFRKWSFHSGLLFCAGALGARAFGEGRRGSRETPHPTPRKGKERRIWSEDEEVKGSRGGGGEKDPETPASSPKRLSRVPPAGPGSPHECCERSFPWLGGGHGPPNQGVPTRVHLPRFPHAGIPGALWAPHGERRVMNGLTGARDAWIATPMWLVLGGCSEWRDGARKARGEPRQGSLWVQWRLNERGKGSRKSGGSIRGAGKGSNEREREREKGRTVCRERSTWRTRGFSGGAALPYPSRPGIGHPSRPPERDPWKVGGPVPPPLPSCKLHALPTP
ncbi:Hypothetical predicted protein [Podarcis lilfordi]|uniref:Uncharacterized protein n=1 Tax=Podarcis lilfordi TaxID=74358 RepID=A0AA35VYM9_9SAUR|nr:Hypothetical predicted protein [Podarcis lilfordi]